MTSLAQSVTVSLEQDYEGGEREEGRSGRVRQKLRRKEKDRERWAERQSSETDDDDDARSLLVSVDQEDRSHRLHTRG